jgi:eukaryotic-like serine/threonine-protein kinase
MNQAAEAPRLTKYDLVEEIGHGGMATVYRALDRRLGREVAVKIIHRHLRENAEVSRRFTVEARAVAKLKHPNIVEIFDVSEDDAPERYLTAELVRGKSLRTVLSEQGSLPAEVAAAVGVELSSALAHAHERDVVHRDVKPENVLFGLPQGGAARADGRARRELPDEGGYREEAERRVSVKITDFGIAKMLDQQGVTATGQVLGSPAYMAPEQIECGNVDARSDVFALGVLLYECMVGHLPFEGKNPAQVLHRVLEGTFAPVDREAPQVGGRWAEIVARSLSQLPDDRPASMGALRAELEGELGALGITDTAEEVSAYFADPDGYASLLPSRLVPSLLSRGQAAQKAGRVVEAAAHLNRALALAPVDPLVVAAVASLTRSRSYDALRRRALRAAGVVAVGSIAALVSARVVRARNVPPPRAEGWVPPAWVTEARGRLLDAPAASASEVVPPGTTSSEPPPPASASSGHRLALPVVGPHPQPAEELRMVKFFVSPKAARFALDGKERSQDDATSFSEELRVGSKHVLSAWVGSTDPCCKEHDKQEAFTVTADDGGRPLFVQISLKLNNATLVSKGPPGYQILCQSLRIPISPVNESFSIAMTDVRRHGNCILLDGVKPIAEAWARKSVDLSPGKTTTLAWAVP